METLLLNASYEPLRRVPWETAINLILDGKVEVVEEYEDRFIRSVSITFKLPSIIRFLQYITPRHKKMKFNRSSVYIRDRGRCQYCSKKVPLKDFTYDHVIPRSKGGTSTWENIVVACVPCNQQKGGRTPKEAGMTLLSTPKQPDRPQNKFIMGMTYEKGMPVSWKKFLGDLAYWNAELEE
jgi:5-methylcytosine-specific restriction endonuclease McrA